MPVPLLKPSANITLACIRDVAGWRKLGAEWPELLANSAANAVFLSWPWLDSWMDVYGDGGAWLVLTARDANGSLLGVAPMMLDRGAGPLGRWLRRLILVGQKADTASEYLDWILRNGHEAEVVAAFCAFIFGEAGRSWDLLRFETMRADSPTLPLLKEQFAMRGRRLAVAPTTTASFLELPETWEKFLASRSGTFRGRWNKFNREHQVVLREVGPGLTVAEGMKIIRDLNEKRWGEQRQSFLSARYTRFHDQVAERLHAAGHLALLFIEADGQIIAGRYDFAYASKAWCFQGGWLPEWEQERAGKMMLTVMMRWCIERGLKEYDFLGGAASYKNEWSSGERAMVDLQAANPNSWRGICHQYLKKVAGRDRGAEQ